jgi:UPF0755 protein
LIGIVVVATVAVTAIASVFIYSTVNTPSIPVKVSIRPGDTTADIALALSSRAIIKSALLFRLYVKERHADERLQSGEYHMRTGMSNEEALELLLKGPYVKYYKITIPEGMTVRETARAVAKASPIKEEQFLASAKKSGYDIPFLKELPDESLEGYLFPKTYTITDKTEAKDLVSMMLWQFQKETSGLDMSYVRSRGLGLHDAMTIASIIEKEVRLSSERELVSQVIYNRLDRQMALQMCSTVQYALPKWKEELTYSDLEVDSPYNTYLHTGLPPGPIASPGIASIKAALQPKPGNYLFFVLTGDDGSHTFTETSEEFERVKKEYGR